MAKETKQVTAREALRARIKARAVAKAAAQKTITAAKKFAKLRRIAFEEPQEVDGALGQLAEGFAELSEALSQMVTNLDMGEPGIPATASLKAHIAAKKNYAARFRRIAEEAPHQFEQAYNEVYLALDGLAEDMEVAADNLGIALAPPLDEAGGVPGIESEPAEIAEEEHEVVEEHPEEASPELEEHVEEEEEKEASGSGSDWFSTDRDQNGQPKKPIASAKKRGSVVTPR